MSDHPLVTELETFQTDFRLAPSTVCVRSVDDSRLYKRLKQGGDCGYRVMERVREWMRKHREKTATDEDSVEAIE